MAPSHNQKRVKGVQISRPFTYGTTAKLFDPVSNPKPEGTPEDHTHSWTVFVKGIDDTDITYWLRKVQFKLHDSIPNPHRTIEAKNPGDPFEVHETGWGEFEITLKLHFVPESLEKAQTLYHHLRLHPYGTTEAEIEEMRKKAEVISWVYDEILFNEPYDQFYEILTSPAPTGKAAGGKGKGNTRKMGGGMVGSAGDRTAQIPPTNRPGNPFSRQSEQQEITRLKNAEAKVKEMVEKMKEELAKQEAEVKALKAEAEVKV